MWRLSLKKKKNQHYDEKNHISSKKVITQTGGKHTEKEKKLEMQIEL